MGTGYRYTLEKGSKKHPCPECGKRRFVRYVDTEAGGYLPDRYGRCDREENCGYALNPYRDGYAKNQHSQEPYSPPPRTPRPRPRPVPFDFATFKQTLNPERYADNTFIQNLLQNVPFPFEVEDVTQAIQLYRLGTVARGYRAGAVTFPFIDIDGNARAVQVKQFDRDNHTTGTDFLHSIIEKHHTDKAEPLPYWLTAYLKQDKRVSCLFGEHLLTQYPRNPVALVEAPKTAIYGALYFGMPDTPQALIWLATYNRSTLTADRVKVLQGRDVVLFPDLSKDGSTFDLWHERAAMFTRELPGTRFTVSDLLENQAPPEARQDGADLADFLITWDWRAFRPTPPPESAASVASEAQKKTLFVEKGEVEPDPIGGCAGNENLIKLEIREIEADAIDGCADNENLIKPEIREIGPEPIIGQSKEDWSATISEIEDYLATHTTAGPLQLSQEATVQDVQQFTAAHLATVKRNSGNPYFAPYLHRLQALVEALQTTKGGR